LHTDELGAWRGEYLVQSGRSLCKGGTLRGHGRSHAAVVAAFETEFVAPEAEQFADAQLPGGFEDEHKFVHGLQGNLILLIIPKHGCYVTKVP